MVLNKAARNVICNAGIVDVISHDWWIYVLMAGAVTPALHHLFTALPMAGFAMVMLGFLCYVIGLYFYANDTKIKHGHGIWHVCVLGGSTLQYLCLLLYVV